MDKPPKNNGGNPDKHDAKTEHHSIRQKIVDWLLWALKLIDEHNGLVTAFGTLVVAAFTVILALATIELKHLGKKQAEDTDRALAISRIAADAAKDSANAAKSAVELAGKTAERQLRAYVLVEHASMIATPDNDIWRALVVIKNFGGTPAYGNKSRVNFKPVEAAENYVFERPPTSLTDTPMDIAPGQEVRLFTQAGRAFTPQEIEAFRTGAAVIFVAGEISYKDAFGVDRLTTFRLQYSPPTNFNAYKDGNNSN